MPSHCAGALDRIGRLSRNGSARPSRTTSTPGRMMRLVVEGLAWALAEDCETLARCLEAICTFPKKMSRGTQSRGPRHAKRIVLNRKICIKPALWNCVASDTPDTLTRSKLGGTMIKFLAEI